VSLAIVKLDTLIQMLPGHRWFSKVEGCKAELLVRLDEKSRISHALSQVEELLGELAPFLVLGPCQVNCRQSEQDWKELGRLPDLSAEL
jgi:hypothetical protein